MQLAGTGAETVEAVGEGDALEKLRDAAARGNPFRVAVIDRVRPNVDSLDLCRIIRRDSELASTAIVSIVSINWSAEHEAALSEPRGSVILSKPVRRAELLNAICGSIAAATAQTLRGMQHKCEETEVESAYPHLGMRVLLAEDNPVNQEVAREFLRLFGCKVELAENGLEAIERIEGGEFDIVLMDCQMPLLDGLSATHQIRETESRKGTRRLPIVAVTANAFDSDRMAALEAGMDDFLTKPFTEEDLGKTLAKWRQARHKSAA
jgi:CheY-like chemotaxis protein